MFGGTPPPAPEPEPAVRRDSMGRKISMTALEALKATQFKPGTSGNPGGNFQRQREHALAVVVKLMKQGKLQPSSTIADFMNLLGDMEERSLRRETPKLWDMETRSEQRTLQRILRASDLSMSRLIETEVSADNLRDLGIGASSKKKARRPSSGRTRSMPVDSKSQARHAKAQH